MKWRVSGSLGERGHESVVVEAPDAQSALQAASERGLRVLSIEPDEPPTGGAAGPAEPCRGLTRARPPILIERTGKRWKALLAISALLLAAGSLGAGVIVARHPRAIGDWPAGLLVCLVVGALGIAGLVWARLGAWWFHG